MYLPGGGGGEGCEYLVQKGQFLVIIHNNKKLTTLKSEYQLHMIGFKVYGFISFVR